MKKVKQKIKLKVKRFQNEGIKVFRNFQIL